MTTASRITQSLTISTPAPSGAQRKRVAQAFSIAQLRLLAKARVPKAVFDYYDGAAEDEITLHANRSAFDGVRLLPRMLNDVSRIDTQCQLLGKPASLPFAVSPTGAIGFSWHQGDIAIARAAGRAGVPYALPTSATASIERVARGAPDTRLWFQAYVLRNRAFTEQLIARAQAAGYEALIITVDMPTGGKRERDLRNDFGLPFRYTPKNILDFALHPRWCASVLRYGMPVLENMIGFTPDAVNTATIASSVGKSYDPSFDWDGLARIRDLWRGKLLVKGILHPDDATRVVALGGDGVVVSNHGGRQLDSAIASLDALPAIVAAVGHKITVIVDGGVRRGGDMLKALALGAHAVMAGRPLLYGVACAGEAGAHRALEILQDELERSMRLCGVASLAQIDKALLA